jgi:xanthine dehydrogenase YagS FAD-binding subunit
MRSAKLAFGGLAHQPWRVLDAEAVLAGAPINQVTANAAADRVLQGARGFGHNDFKIPLVRSTLRAVLAEV